MKKEPFCILLTSAGVTTSLNLIKGFRDQDEYAVKIIGVDKSPFSAGFHLCDHKYLVPSIKNPEYILKIFNICKRERVNLLIPLYSKEILLFSKNLKLFEEIGVKIFISSPLTIEMCNNKLKFIEFLLENKFPVPRIYKSDNIPIKEFPVIIKPFSGSGSKNTVKISNPDLLDAYLIDKTGLIIQEFIEGKEYTIDLFCNEKSEVLSYVIRERIEVKAGLAVKCKTVKNQVTIKLVHRLVKKLGIVGPANVQIIFDTCGQPYIIEVNPRFAAGGLPLSIKAGANFPLLMLNLLKGKTTKLNDYKEGLVMIRYYHEMYFCEEDILNEVKKI